MIYNTYQELVDKLNELLKENKELKITLTKANRIIKDLQNRGDDKMSAKEMFEKLGYECFDNRDDKEHLPLTIFYRKEDTPEVVLWVSFDLPDKKYRTNVKNIESKNNGKFLQAINKQISELGWNNEK